MQQSIMLTFNLTIVKVVCNFEIYITYFVDIELFYIPLDLRDILFIFLVVPKVDNLDIN